MGSIDITNQGPVATIAFNNPARHNAMSLSMWKSLRAVLEKMAEDRSCRALVLTGVGEKAFVSGADISEFDAERNSEEKQRDYDEAVTAALEALAAIRIPTIAAIRGWCIGGGLAIALACDLRVCASDARLGTPAAKLGIGYGYQPVKQMIERVGYPSTLEILFTGRLYEAPEALRIGLVNRMEEAAGFEAFVDHYVSGIAANAPLVLAAAKIIAREVLKGPGSGDIAMCDAAAAACNASEDFAEGRRAFAEKRVPRFRGA